MLEHAKCELSLHASALMARTIACSIFCHLVATILGYSVLSCFGIKRQTFSALLRLWLPSSVLRLAVSIFFMDVNWTGPAVTGCRALQRLPHGHTVCGMTVTKNMFCNPHLSEQVNLWPCRRLTSIHQRRCPKIALVWPCCMLHLVLWLQLFGIHLQKHDTPCSWRVEPISGLASCTLVLDSGYLLAASRLTS